VRLKALPLARPRTDASCRCTPKHLEHDNGEVFFRHACKMGLEGIVSKRLGSRYRSGRSTDWLKFKNPAAEEDWGMRRVSYERSR
jgi:ATP-dependent DNA ligase